MKPDKEDTKPTEEMHPLERKYGKEPPIDPKLRWQWH